MRTVGLGVTKNGKPSNEELDKKVSSLEKENSDLKKEVSDEKKAEKKEIADQDADTKKE